MASPLPSETAVGQERRRRSCGADGSERRTGLSERERLVLNQIRSLGYLYTFGLVEELILPFLLDHARPQLHGDPYAVRALLGFASAAKHIHLFRRFREEFERDFGAPCAQIGPPEAVAKAVLAHQPLAVALAILQIEWMTPRHWIEGVRQPLDCPTREMRFRSADVRFRACGE